MKILRNSLVFALCLLIGGCFLKNDEPKFKFEGGRGAAAPAVKKEGALIDEVDIKMIGEQGVAFENLARKFKSGEGVAIRFFGDSHVASDDFINGFRQEFLGEQNAVGFSYAAMPKYHKNSFLSYEISGFEVLNSQRDKFDDYPLCGVAAKAQKKGAKIVLQTQNLAEQEWEFEILFKGEKGGEILHINAPNFSRKLTAKSRWQSARMKLYAPVEITALQSGVVIGGYKIFKKGAKFADHCGINGATSLLWQKWNKQTFAELKSLKYDAVVIEYGTNDAFNENLDILKFSQSLEGFIQNIRQILPDTAVIILSPPPTDKPKFSAVQQALRQIAAKEGAWLYDMDEFVRRNGGKRAWIEFGLSKEDVHLTSLGYQRIGKAFGRELKNMLKSQP